jgi:glycosyltransferase involved in cell wall biosynthesis
MSEKKISVVIPVYNVEMYLAECIDSVINQTIDFEKNIEIVLVNDGSKDSSGAICESYLEKYPDNIQTEFEEKWSKLGPIYRLEAKKK